MAKAKKATSKETTAPAKKITAVKKSSQKQAAKLGGVPTQGR
jgi:hypothetical protein